MNDFNIIFYGLYATLFLTPMLALVLRNRFEKGNKVILGIALFGVVSAYLCIRFGVSLLGTLADVLFFYFLHFLSGVSIVKLTSFKNSVVKILGGVCVVPFIALPLLSIPAFLGIILVVGDFQTVYTNNDSSGYSCRITSYGNATTSTGGYKAKIYKKYWVIEYQVGFENFETAGIQEITPESVCNAALSKFKS